MELPRFLLFCLLLKLCRSDCVVEDEVMICTNMTLEQNTQLERNESQPINELDFNSCVLPIIPNNVFVKFKDVETLWLDNMEIKEIAPLAFDSMENLKNLHLQHNEIGEFYAKSLKTRNLEVLDLSFNNLAKLDVFDLKNLQELYLNDNKLKEIKFDKLQFPALRRLDLYSNEIESLSGVIQSPHLNNLLLYGNDIKQIHVATFILLYNLKTLDLSENKLTEITTGTFHSLITLEILELHQNQLEEIGSGLFISQTRLQILLLNNNNLHTLKKYCFSSLTNLEELYLDHNKLEHLSSNVFDTLTHLKKLTLNNNALTKFPSPFPHGCPVASTPYVLEELHLHNNKLSKYTNNDYSCLFKSLKKVSLNGNEWDCDSVGLIVTKFIRQGVTVTDATDSDNVNVWGITCKE